MDTYNTYIDTSHVILYSGKSTSISHIFTQVGQRKEFEIFGSLDVFDLLVQ